MSELNKYAATESVAIWLLNGTLVHFMPGDVLTASQADFEEITAHCPGAFVLVTEPPPVVEPPRNPNREKDAQLHSMLYGKRIEWRPARWDEYEEQWVVYPVEEAWPGGEWHPCFELTTHDDGTPVLDGVPLFTTDLADARDALADLPEKAQLIYVYTLLELANPGKVDMGGDIPAEQVLAMLLAAPSQMTEAMIQSLEVLD